MHLTSGFCLFKQSNILSLFINKNKCKLKIVSILRMFTEVKGQIKAALANDKNTNLKKYLFYNIVLQGVNF